jgi:hypothetical protein
MPRTLTVPEANRRFYKGHAGEYDDVSPVMDDHGIRTRMIDLLDAALAATDIAPSNIAALDACGGTGNVSMAMHDREITPVLLDVSPDMTAIWAEKARSHGLINPEIYVEPIEDFLRRDTRTWDLVTFSSALHHLDNYLEVLELVRQRLNLGGLVLTVFDPTFTTPRVHRFRRLDWLTWLALNEPRTFGRGLERVIHRLAVRRPEGDEDYVGRIAERHAIEGVDEAAVLAGFPPTQYEVLRHDRVYGGWTPVTEWVAQRLRLASNFSLLIRKRS